MEMVACLWGEGVICRIAYLGGKRVLEENRRVVNQRNHNESIRQARRGGQAQERVFEAELA